MAHIQNAFPGGGGGGANRWFLVSGEQSTSVGWTTVGSAYIDPTKGAAVCTLHLVTETSNAANPCIARLFNADDAVAVGGAGGEVSQASTVPAHSTLALLAGTTVGFPNAAKTYWLQIQLSGGAAPDAASCKSAYVEQS